MRRVFPVRTGLVVRTTRGGRVVTMLAVLAAAPAGAANDNLVLPPPTYPDVTRLFDAGDDAGALERLTAAVQGGVEPVFRCPDPLTAASTRQRAQRSR